MKAFSEKPNLFVKLLLLILALVPLIFTMVSVTFPAPVAETLFGVQNFELQVPADELIFIAGIMTFVQFLLWSLYCFLESIFELGDKVVPPRSMALYRIAILVVMVFLIALYIFLLFQIYFNHMS